MKLFKHVKSGKCYELICEAFVEASGGEEKVAVYKSVENGQVWSRPVNEFYDGRFARVHGVIESDAARLLDDIEDLESACTEFYRYAMHYFDGEDANEEVNDELKAQGLPADEITAEAGAAIVLSVMAVAVHANIDLAGAIVNEMKNKLMARKKAA